MPFDTLIDGAQLDENLSAIADAIRAKGGTSAQLSFPSGMTQAIFNLPSGDSGSDIQVYSGRGTVGNTTYKASGVKLTIVKTGTYNITWMSARSYASGTSGSQLYINNTAYGSAFENFSETNNNNVCYCQLTNVSLTAGQVIEVYAKGSSSSRYTTVGNLIAESTR